MLKDQFGIKVKLSVVFAALFIVFFIYGIVTYSVFKQVKIGGPYYTHIIQTRALMQNVLPSPANLQESFLLAHQEVASSTPTTTELLIQQSQRSLKKYQEQLAKWVQRFPKGDLRDLVATEADKYAQTFFSIWQSRFYPALASGNKEEAAKILAGPLTDAYIQYERIISKIEDLANAELDSLETEAHNYETKVSIYLFAFWFFFVIVGGILSFILLNKALSNLLHLSNKLESISHEIQEQTDDHLEAHGIQSKVSMKTTNTIEQLGKNHKQCESIAEQSSEQAQIALKVSNEGYTKLEMMIDHLTKHREKVAEIVEHILRLSQLTKQIHNIASITSHLTNQTNILALNAAVQAANVKQYGEGFSVIAGEIRKLADESKKFLGHIDVLAENIQGATDSIIKIVDEGNNTIQEILMTGEATTEVFTSVKENVTISCDTSKQTFQAIKYQSETVQEALKAIQAMDEVNSKANRGVQKIQQITITLNELSHTLKRNI